MKENIRQITSTGISVNALRGSSPAVNKTLFSVFPAVERPEVGGDSEDVAVVEEVRFPSAAVSVVSYSNPTRSNKIGFD